VVAPFVRISPGDKTNLFFYDVPLQRTTFLVTLDITKICCHWKSWFVVDLRQAANNMENVRQHS